jgi:fibronectin type 3 domain-containing protein
VITKTERFPITGSFDVFWHSVLQVHLNAGKNSVVMFAVSSHAVPRLDQLKVTPATASVPAGPTGLSVTSSGGKVMLAWTGSAGATAYHVYRGTASDGELNTLIATTNAATTTYVDAGLTNGVLYYYKVSASNGVGVSPDSNEVAVVFMN